MYPEVHYPEDMGGQGGWVLRGYERHGDALVSEHALTGVDTDTLARFIRKHFDSLEDAPLCFVYPLTPDIAAAPREEVGVYVIEDEKKHFSLSAVYGNSWLVDYSGEGSPPASLEAWGIR